MVIFNFLEGLPSDELSIENAICIMQSQLSPYLIDPSSRAVEWLKAHLESGENSVQVINPKDDRSGPNDVTKFVVIKIRLFLLEQ